MAHRKEYDPRFKALLFTLREEKGLGIRDALDEIWEKNPAFARKHKGRLAGSAGIQRAAAIVNNMRNTKTRKAGREIVWSCQLVCSTGTTITNERLSNATAKRVLQALGMPLGVV